MTFSEKKQPVQGAPQSADNEFYITWGRETLKNNLVLTNEVLRQLLTLNVALLGGSIILLNDKFVDANIRMLAMIFFFFSLIVSFVGIMPFGRGVDLRVADDIRKHKETAFKWKLICLMVAGGLILFGFMAIAIGLFTHSP